MSDAVAAALIGLLGTIASAGIGLRGRRAEARAGREDRELAEEAIEQLRREVERWQRGCCCGRGETAETGSSGGGGARGCGRS
jgi:type II secretory pathway pseudopilin PulG